MLLTYRVLIDALFDHAPTEQEPDARLAVTVDRRVADAEAGCEEGSNPQRGRSRE